MSNTDDNLRKQIRDVMQEYKLDPTVAGGTYYINRVMTLINQDREAREALGAIQGAEFAENCLYDNCPTGDVTAWDMLKGFQKTQEQLSQFVTELKKTAFPPDSKAKA